MPFATFRRLRLDGGCHVTAASIPLPPPAPAGDTAAATTTVARNNGAACTHARKTTFTRTQLINIRTRPHAHARVPYRLFVTHPHRAMRNDAHTVTNHNAHALFSVRVLVPTRPPRRTPNRVWCVRVVTTPFRRRGSRVRLHYSTLFHRTTIFLIRLLTLFHFGFDFSSGIA